MKLTRRLMPIAALLILLLIPLRAVSADPLPPAQVMLLGTFHFSDPGQDSVKTRSLDVTTAGSQAYLEGLCARIARDFQPTQVLLEYAPENAELISDRYQAYLDDRYELSVNEIYQLGFRIAQLSGRRAVGTLDDREIEWRADAMLAYAEEHDRPAFEAFHALIANVQKAAQPGERVLVIAGSGHVAILADLLALDEARQAVAVGPFL